MEDILSFRQSDDGQHGEESLQRALTAMLVGRMLKNERLTTEVA